MEGGLGDLLDKFWGCQLGEGCERSVHGHRGGLAVAAERVAPTSAAPAPVRGNRDHPRARPSPVLHATQPAVERVPSANALEAHEFHEDPASIQNRHLNVPSRVAPDPNDRADLNIQRRNSGGKRISLRRISPRTAPANIGDGEGSDMDHIMSLKEMHADPSKEKAVLAKKSGANSTMQDDPDKAHGGSNAFSGCNSLTRSLSHHNKFAEANAQRPAAGCQE